MITLSNLRLHAAAYRVNRSTVCAPVPAAGPGTRLEVLAGAGPSDARLGLFIVELPYAPLPIRVPCCYAICAFLTIDGRPCSGFPARLLSAAHSDHRVALTNGSGRAVDLDAVPRLAEQLIRLRARLYLQRNSSATLTAYTQWSTSAKVRTMI